jgi:hypothetical protein
LTAIDSDALPEIASEMTGTIIKTNPPTTAPAIERIPPITAPVRIKNESPSENEPGATKETVAE